MKISVLLLSLVSIIFIFQQTIESKKISIQNADLKREGDGGFNYQYFYIFTPWLSSTCSGQLTGFGFGLSPSVCSATYSPNEFFSLNVTSQYSVQVQSFNVNNSTSNPSCTQQNQNTSTTYSLEECNAGNDYASYYSVSNAIVAYTVPSGVILYKMYQDTKCTNVLSFYYITTDTAVVSFNDQGYKTITTWSCNDAGNPIQKECVYNGSEFKCSSNNIQQNCGDSNVEISCFA
eukprot:gene2880-3581_t